MLDRLLDEDTGHIDIFAKFVSRDTVLVGQYDYDQDPENSRILDRNAALLKKVQIEKGRYLNVVRIPMGDNRDGIFRSYTNSLHVNDMLVMPTYGRHSQFETEAISVYKQVLPPATRIVKIDASDIIELDGAIHCIALGMTFRDY